MIGPRESLAVHELTVDGRLHLPVDRADAKLRHRSPVIAADVEPTDAGFRLALDEPGYAVATGQVAALYEGDAVVGAGTIASVV